MVVMNVRARGRASLTKKPNAIEMVVQANSPPGGTPYLNALLPQVPLNATALAIANDPKTIALRGALWGSGGAAVARRHFQRRRTWQWNDWATVRAQRTRSALRSHRARSAPAVPA